MSEFIYTYTTTDANGENQGWCASHAFKTEEEVAKFLKGADYTVHKQGIHGTVYKADHDEDPYVMIKILKVLKV